MAKYSSGLYEKIVTEAIGAGLEGLDSKLSIKKEKPNPAEVADRIALHVGCVVQAAISCVKECIGSTVNGQTPLPGIAPWLRNNIDARGLF